MTEDLPIGSLVERYEIEAVLGRGGMATVYRVRHSTLGTLHALKVLTMDSRSVRERLVQEGRVQATLQHPNIVDVRDVLDVHGAPGLLLEYVDGIAMDQWLDVYRPTVEEALSVFRGVLAGVGFAHAQGLIHRDLKPANVMLEVSEAWLSPKITDFGLAKLTEDAPGHTRTGSTMGTPAYMPPEQIRDASRVDRRADLYALGCVLYELFCGVTPFHDDDLLELFTKVKEGRYVPAAEINPDTPDAVSSCIRALLAPTREARPADCADVLALLDGQETVPSGAMTGAARKVDPEEPTRIAADSPGGQAARQLLGEVKERIRTQATAPPSTQSAPETVQVSIAAASVPLQLSQPELTEEVRVGGSPGLPKLMLAGLLGMGLLAMAGVALVTGLWTLDLPPFATEAQNPEPTLVDPVPQPEEPAPIPDPTVPAPEVEPRPTPEPTPTPATPGPTIKPTAEPAPEPMEAKSGAWEVSGARTAFLTADGQRLRPGDPIPPGVWPVTVTLDGASAAVPVGKFSFRAGKTTRLHCDSDFQQCLDADK